MKSIHTQLSRELLNAYAARRQDQCFQIEEIDLPTGTAIIRQGKALNNVFIVLKGSMKTHVNTPKGTEYLVALEGPGGLIGEVEALTGDVAVCSVTAETSGRVARIPYPAYETWLEEDHAFTLLVNKIITYRLRAITQRAATHLSYPLEYSVLKLIKMLTEEERKDEVHLSPQTLANYLGTNTRSINRILKDLRGRGILSMCRSLRVTSKPGLDQALRAHDQ